MRKENKINSKYKKQEQFLLLKTILSALLFSFSFVFIKSFGFFIIPAFIILFIVIKDIEKIKHTIFYGMLWGIAAFGLYFVWLYKLLVFKTGADFFLATGLYLFIIFYSGFLSSVYFLITRWLFDFIGLIIKRSRIKFNFFPTVILSLTGDPGINKKSNLNREEIKDWIPSQASSRRARLWRTQKNDNWSVRTFKYCKSLYFCLFYFAKNYIFLKIILFFISTFLFFYFIDKQFLFFLEKNTGYPFLNPLIPLVKYKWFLFLYSFVFSLNQTPMQPSLDLFKETKIIHLKPVIKSYNNNFNAITAGQMVYHQLANLNLDQYANKYKNIVLLAPETYYPYPLNKNKSSVKLWSNVLPSNTYFFLGSQRRQKGGKNGNKIFQTIYLLRLGRIIDFYDKKHRVFFAEKIPSYYKNSEWSKKLFLNGKTKFSLGKQKNKIFNLPNGLSILPRVCSEFFYKVNFQDTDRVDIVFFFVNDSWFMPYFKQVMQNLTELIELEIRTPIFYINHT